MTSSTRVLSLRAPWSPRHVRCSVCVNARRLTQHIFSWLFHQQLLPSANLFELLCSLFYLLAPDGRLQDPSFLVGQHLTTQHWPFGFRAGTVQRFFLSRWFYTIDIQLERVFTRGFSSLCLVSTTTGVGHQSVPHYLGFESGFWRRLFP